MFPKLLKLIIKSRFSVSYFAIIFIFVIYAALAVELSTTPTGAAYTEYYFAGVLSLFSVLSLVSAGLAVTRSDNEFLLVSPVKKRTLAYALYIGQYLYMGPLIFIAFLIYTSTAQLGPLVKGLLVIDVFMLSALPVSMSVLASNLRTVFRIPAAVAVVAWIISFYFGNPVSPIAIFSGHVYISILSTILISAIFLISAIALLGSDSLSYRISSRGSRVSEYKKIKNYSGLSPLRAIFRYGFSQFEMASRTNFSGTPMLSGRRIRSSIVLLIFIAISIVYGFAAYKLNPTSTGPIGGNVNIITVFVTIYMSVFPPILMSSSTVPMERAWLSFTSMTPSRYMPAMILVKALQIVYLMSGFVVVDVVLYFMGISGALPNLYTFLLYEPIFFAIFTTINFRVQTMQIKDEALITNRFSASQFVLTPFVLLFFGIAAVSVFLPIVDIVIVPVLVAVVIAMMLWKNFWNNRVFKLVEKGFI